MKLFGFEITKSTEEKEDQKLQKITGDIPDGSLEIDHVPGGVETGTYALDFSQVSKTEADLIQTYRDTAMLSSVEDAIDEIINEAIVVQDQEKIVEISLGDTNFSAGVQKKIVAEFEYLLGLLNFHDCGDQIFRQWYIDGRQYYHKVIKTGAESEGIKELNWLDPKKTVKVRELAKTKKDAAGKSIELVSIAREYFLFDPKTSIKEKNNPQVTFLGMPYEQVLELTTDSVSYTTSGLIDLQSGRAQSYLHPALKPANQLTLLEDSTVVYRLTRAPERRIFYIDVGQLGAGRAEQHVARQMNKYRNKLVYDQKTGKVDATKAHISMMEDIWLPRKEGGRSTEVTTLQGAQNTGNMEDVMYFKRNLAQALNVPVSRLDSESTFNMGINGEIKRDELKFSKFVDKIRRRFNTFFYDILKTQLVLKKIITPDDWSENRQKIRFVYNRDSYITEMQEGEMWKQRFELLGLSSVYTGKDKYLSMRWNTENVLKLSDEEMAQIAKDWKAEPDEAPMGPIGPADLEGGFDDDAPAVRPAPKKKEPEEKPKKINIDKNDKEEQERDQN